MEPKNYVWYFTLVPSWCSTIDMITFETDTGESIRVRGWNASETSYNDN